MGNLDDYNDRLRKQTLGAPVGPPTNATQMAADMAADAQRRAMAAGRSSGGSYSGQSDHSVRDLLILLVISAAIGGAGTLGANYLPGDWIYLGVLAMLAGGVFGIACIGILLKRALTWSLGQIIIGIVIALSSTWRFITRPFRRR